MSSPSPVAEILGRLHRHRDLINELFEQRHVEITTGNAGPIDELAAAGLIVRTDAETVRLNSRLREFLNFSTQRDRLVRVDADLASRTEELALQVRHLEIAQDIGDMDQYHLTLDSIEETIHSFSDHLEAIIRDVYGRVERVFGQAVTLELRRTETEYYQSKVKKLVDALALARGVLSEDRFVGNPDVARLLFPLLRRFNDFHQQLQDTLGVIGEYLFKIRQLVERANRLRTIAEFLRKRRDWTPAASEDAFIHQRRFAQPTPLRVRAFPNLADSGMQRELEELAGHIRARPQFVPEAPKRAPSTLTHMDPIQGEEADEPLVDLINDLVMGVLEANRPASAVAFWHAHRVRAGVELGRHNTESWLWLLADYCESDAAVGEGHRARTVVDIVGEGAPDPEFTGNWSVRDYWVVPKGMQFNPAEALA